ncbi:MAG TPA: IS110 family transposase [Phenylobacterium sp.]|jgi:transposase|nr:IS110 family transposase [Phenylobacterium sp.]
MPQDVEFFGVDVSSRELEVRGLGEARSWQAPNAPKGWRRLAKLWAGQAVVVGIEPSGGYEAGLVRTLVEAAIQVRWADPARVRALAKALGAPAKTDAIDAAMIARYVAETGGRPVQLDADRQALRDLLAARRAAIETAGRLTLQAQGLAAGSPRKALERIAAEAERTAKALKDQLIEALRQRPALEAQWRLLQTAPGVGPLVAAELIASMPELGRVSGKAIAKLAGLAPFIRQSGAWRGKATCSGGRARPRGALYLAAMASLRAKAGLRPVYDRLVANGKPRMVALVACMRRLLVALNAMATEQTPWRGLTP